jgi:hypothetical protein
MTPSLPELQRRFAGWLADAAGAPLGVAVYRNSITTNYRKALAATYPVVRDLVGVPHFAAAVDAFASALPSTAGDLNAYGAEFAAFLAQYPHARDLPYLPDVARLEWALDEAQRAADPDGTPEATLAALAAVPGAAVVRLRFALDPSCRLVPTSYPALRIWQVHQPGHDGDMQVDLRAGGECLLVRRERGVPVIERISSGDSAWLSALAGDAELAGALDAALAVDATFDLGTALRTHIASGTLMAVLS